MIKNAQWHRYKSWQDGVTLTNSIWRKTILSEKLKEKYYFACEIHTILQFFIQIFYSRTLELFYGDVIWLN